MKDKRVTPHIIKHITAMHLLQSGVDIIFLGLIVFCPENFSLSRSTILIMPLSLQSKLLRAIQEKEIRPIGATKDIKIDVRLIAATNQDPQALLTEGKIREDMYFRLNVVSLKLPELKDRKEDIPSRISSLSRRVTSQKQPGYWVSTAVPYTVK